MRLLALSRYFEKVGFIASDFISPFGVSSQEAIKNRMPGHRGIEEGKNCRWRKRFMYVDQRMWNGIRWLRNHSNDLGNHRFFICRTSVFITSGISPYKALNT